MASIAKGQMQENERFNNWSNVSCHVNIGTGSKRCAQINKKTPCRIILTNCSSNISDSRVRKGMASMASFILRSIRKTVEHLHPAKPSAFIEYPRLVKRHLLHTHQQDVPVDRLCHILIAPIP